MPLNLDTCITGIFVPGNIGASSGQPPIVRVMPPLTPTITSTASISNPENAVLAHELTADKFVAWSIVGGADAAQFEISGSILRWLADGVKDFETPDDADTSNTYEITIRGADVSSRFAEQTITVTVTDVIEVVVPPGFADSAVIIGPVAVNGDGTMRQANVAGVMVNL